jgi:PEP-CTERM motif
MFNFKSQLLGIAAVLPVAAVVSFAGSAQAANIVGSLAFSDGTDNWYSQVAPGAGDVFSVTFNPGSINLVTTQDGFFTPPFNGDPVQGLAPSTGNFEYVSTVSDGTTNRYTYKLTNNLVFEYTNGAKLTWGVGTEFVGFQNATNSLQFDLAPNQTVPLVENIGETDFSLFASTFQFSDTSAAAGGTYNGSVDLTVSVPEPTTMLGLGLVASGMVMARRRKLVKA